MKTETETQAKLEELTTDMETTNNDIIRTALAKEWNKLYSLHHHKTQVSAKIDAFMWVLGYEN